MGIAAIMSGDDSGINRISGRDEERDKQQAANRAAAQQAEGVRNAQQIMQQNINAALPVLEGAYNSSYNDIALGTLNQDKLIRQGVSGAKGDVRRAGQSAEGRLNQGQQSALSSLYGGFNQAAAGFQPAIDQGNQASQLQAAYSGALGPEAQAQAFQQYQESPGQQFYRDEQEKALTRNAARMGMSQSGNAWKALQDRAFQQAQTDYGNQFARLGSLADRGFAGQQQASGYQAAAGQGAAQINQNTASQLAGLDTAIGNALAGLNTSQGSALANLYGNQATQLAQSRQNYGNTYANTLLGTGSEQAQLAQNLGTALAGPDARIANTPRDNSLFGRFDRMFANVGQVF